MRDVWPLAVALLAGTPLGWLEYHRRRGEYLRSWFVITGRPGTPEKAPRKVHPNRRR
jgi:hypothetical protein